MEAICPSSEHPDGDPQRRRRRAAALVTALLAGVLSLVSASPASAADAPSVTALASATADLKGGDAASGSRPQLAEDGRFVAFSSSAKNIVAGTTTSVERVYLRDLWSDQVTLVSRAADGSPNASPAYLGAITSSGSHVAFSTTSQLAATDTNAVADVYVWTRSTGALEQVSRAWGGGSPNGSSGLIFTEESGISISDDGRYVAFESNATNLLPTAESNGKTDVYRRDRTNGTTTIVSRNGAAELDGHSYAPDMSADGRYVVFMTLATNLGGIDTNGTFDVWLRDFDAISPSKVTFGLDADPNGSSTNPRVSDDGTKVMFESTATDLVASDTNAKRDVFVRNRTASTTTRVSVADGTGAQLPDGGFDADMTGNASRISFVTASAAASGDSNGRIDAYLREGSTTRRQSVGTKGQQSEQHALKTSVADSSVAWSTTQAFASVDTNNSIDVYVRHQPFVGPFSSLDTFAARQLSRIRGTETTLEQLIPVRTALEDGASPYTFILREVDRPAFSAKRAPLVRLYWAYFERRPDLGGLTFWLNRYNSGKRLVDISQEFAKSSEFRNTYGSTTPEQFVTLVYQNVLERQPDAAGLAYWADKIRAGTPRGQVMTNFSESSEGRRVIGPRSDSILVALAMYGKIPSKPLFDAMVADRQAGFPREIIPIYVLGAPEYAATIS